MKELQKFLSRPRYLQAIPSLVVLTTAMAWGALPDADAGDEVGKRPGVTLSQRAGSGMPTAGAAGLLVLQLERKQG